MKKVFIIFSLGMILVASLFGSQIMNFDSAIASDHKMDMGCESYVCSTQVVSSCAQHCISAVVQDQILPMLLSPLFVYVMILFVIIAFVVVELKQSFTLQLFILPLSRRLALNTVRRE